MKNFFAALAVVMLAFFPNGVLASSSVNGCSFFSVCTSTPTTFTVPDGISNLVCTYGAGCIDVSATYQQGYIKGYEGSGAAGAVGFTDGFTDGYKVGLANGNQAGLNQGEQDGFNAGYNADYGPA